MGASNGDSAGDKVGVPVNTTGDPVDGGGVVGNERIGEPVVGWLVKGDSVVTATDGGRVDGELVGPVSVVGASIGVSVATVVNGPDVGALFCATKSVSIVVFVNSLSVLGAGDGTGVVAATGTNTVGDAALNDEGFSLLPFCCDVMRNAARAATIADTVRKQANRRFLVVPGLAAMRLLDEW